MTPDEKLVEALAEFMYRCARRFFLGAAPLWADLTPRLRGRWVCHAERMIEDHRLVQLPEEPTGWVDRGWRGSSRIPGGRLLAIFDKRAEPDVAVYVIPALEADDDA